jgi:hypothetical protein
MKEKNFIDSIAKGWEAIGVAGLENSFTQPTSLDPDAEFKRIARDSGALYEDIFLLGLKTRSYNIILSDYAFLQFSRDGDADVRFAYYPNPFLGAASDVVKELGEFRDLVTEGEFSLEDYLHMVSEVRRSQHAPLLRYENAPRQYDELKHPCSHFHFGHHGGNRWPAKKVLSPYVFCLMVLKMFYPEEWSSGGFLKKGSKRFSLDELYSCAKEECEELPVHLFSNKERKQFYLS